MASDQKPSNVTVAVVSFQTKDKLERCLKCIEPHHEVIVVDNASTDGSPEMVAQSFPGITLIRNASNCGFGEANNQAIEAATRPLVLLLNSDAYAFPGAIDVLAEVFEDPTVVCAGGRLLNMDGSLQGSTANRLTLWAVVCEQLYLERLLPRSTVFNGYWNTATLATRQEPSETPQVMGACLMMRPVERFDPRYFLYCEDTDLCARLAKHGKTLYVPAAQFTHELGASSSQDRWRSVARYNRGKELYFALHHGPGAAVACWLLNRLGALLRMLVWTLATMVRLGHPHFSRQVYLFVKVLFAPIQGPPDPRKRN